MSDDREIQQPAGPTQGQRIQAAQALGGFKSIPDLAEAIGVPGFGVKTLRRCATDERKASAGELGLIARACRVDPAFFDIDFRRLSERLHLPIVEVDWAPPVTTEEDYEKAVEEVMMLRAQQSALQAREHGLRTYLDDPRTTDPEQRSAASAMLDRTVRSLIRVEAQIAPLLMGPIRQWEDRHPAEDDQRASG